MASRTMACKARKIRPRRRPLRISLPSSSAPALSSTGSKTTPSTAGRDKSAPPKDIQAFEQRSNVRVPADLREYFQRLNGIDAAPGFFRFFPLSRLIALKSPSFATFETDRYFVFADYMMGTWYYAIYLGEDQFLQNRVILPDLPGPPILASNFSEFIELYLTDSARLYGNQ
jgi:hypothetical protein